MRNMHKKKYINYILLLFFIVSFSMTYAFWASSVQGASQSGDGSLEIGSWVPTGFTGVTQDGAGDMITLNEIGTGSNLLTGKYIQMSDINWNSQAFMPIGGANGIFSGEFYGNGKKISNLSITTNQQYLGLFSRNSGTISGVSLDNITINVSSTIELYAGGITGLNSGSIYFSYTTGSISATTTYSGNTMTRTTRGGGIAGSNSNEIKQSHSSATVNVTTNVNITQNGRRTGNSISKAGGLVGENSSTNGIVNTYSNGIVSATSIASATGNSFGYATVYAGGLVGESTTANGVNSSFATGSVTATGSGKSSNTMYFGGLNGLGAANSSYKMIGQSVTSNVGSQNAIGSLETLANLQNGSWIVSNWGLEYWIFEANSYPRLKKNQY